MPEDANKKVDRADLGRFFGDAPNQSGYNSPAKSQTHKKCPFLAKNDQFCSLDDELCPFVGFSHHRCTKYRTAIINKGKTPSDDGKPDHRQGSKPLGEMLTEAKKKKSEQKEKASKAEKDKAAEEILSQVAPQVSPDDNEAELANIIASVARHQMGAHVAKKNMEKASAVADTFTDFNSSAKKSEILAYLERHLQFRPAQTSLFFRELDNQLTKHIPPSIVRWRKTVGSTPDIEGLDDSGVEEPAQEKTTTRRQKKKKKKGKSWADQDPLGQDTEEPTAPSPKRKTATDTAPTMPGAASWNFRNTAKAKKFAAAAGAKPRGASKKSGTAEARRQYLATSALFKGLGKEEKLRIAKLVGHENPADLEKLMENEKNGGGTAFNKTLYQAMTASVKSRNAAAIADARADKAARSMIERAVRNGHMTRQKADTWLRDPEHKKARGKFANAFNEAVSEFNERKVKTVTLADGSKLDMPYFEIAIPKVTAEDLRVEKAWQSMGAQIMMEGNQYGTTLSRLRLFFHVIRDIFVPLVAYKVAGADGFNTARALLKALTPTYYVHLLYSAFKKDFNKLQMAKDTRFDAGTTSQRRSKVNRPIDDMHPNPDRAVLHARREGVSSEVWGKRKRRQVKRWKEQGDKSNKDWQSFW